MMTNECHRRDGDGKRPVPILPPSGATGNISEVCPGVPVAGTAARPSGTLAKLRSPDRADPKSLGIDTASGGWASTTHSPHIIPTSRSIPQQNTSPCNQRWASQSGVGGGFESAPRQDFASGQARPAREIRVRHIFSAATDASAQSGEGLESVTPCKIDGGVTKEFGPGGHGIGTEPSTDGTDHRMHLPPALVVGRMRQSQGLMAHTYRRQCRCMRDQL
jgi:hypothetical protein